MPALLLSAFAPPRSIADFADRLVAHDLPGLPDGRRAETVAFADRRIAHLPSPMKVGVTAVATLVAVASKLVGGARVAALLARHPLPLLGEYVRLVRSLAYAFVWDTWPQTDPTGRPLDADPDDDEAGDGGLAADPGLVASAGGARP